MGRSPCCSKEGLNKGAWTAHEDKVLTEYIKAHGEGRWRNLPKKAGMFWGGWGETNRIIQFVFSSKVREVKNKK